LVNAKQVDWLDILTLLKSKYESINPKKAEPTSRLHLQRKRL